MKTKLLLIFLPVFLLATTLQAQNKVWDFGNDTANWSLNAAGATVATVVDGLTLEPGESANVASIDGNNATWEDGYGAVQRLKLNGSGGIDPADSETYFPKSRFLSFPVDGPAAVKIWFRASGGSDRSLWVTDGFARVTHFDSPDGDTAPQYIEANYTGGAGTLYVFGARNAFNLYKMEISTQLLGTKKVDAAISTKVSAVGNRVYISNVKAASDIKIYSITGTLVKSLTVKEDADFEFNSGLFIATVKTPEGQKSFKIVLR